MEMCKGLDQEDIESKNGFNSKTDKKQYKNRLLYGLVLPSLIASLDPG